MRYIYKLVYLSALLALVYSCKKDQNNYNYEVLNKLSVKLDETNYTVVQRDALQIKPVITESLSGSGPYKYEWVAYKTTDIPSYAISASNPATKAFKLSEQKDLNAEIVLAPGQYFIQYTITDTKTNLKTFNQYNLTVNGKYYDGWLVMSNKAGKADLSFIRRDDQVFMNVISAPNNGLELTGKGLAAFSAIQAQMEDVNVFTDQEVYRFSANDFALTGKSSALFETNITPISNPSYGVNTINFDQYVVSNGNVYASLTPSAGLGRYSDKFNVPANASVFPYFMTGSKYYTLFYDNVGKRFLQNSYNTRSLLVFPSITGDDVKYDVSNVGKTAIAIDRGPGNEYFLVMKDNTDYYLYSILPNNAKPAGVMQNMSAMPDIAQAVSFAASAVNRQMYYAVGNKIYLYDISANSAKLAYQFPANTVIRDMEMLKSKGWGKTDDLFNKRLAVATYNGTEGEVYYLDLLPIGDVANGTFSKKFGGFGDIAQINYRNPNL